MWYSWSSMEAFEAWHQAACAFLGIPKASTNAMTGSVDHDAAWTTSYTTAVAVAPDDIRAFVESHVAAHCASQLGTPSVPPLIDHVD